jgi:hypothetical protein
MSTKHTTKTTAQQTSTPPIFAAPALDAVGAAVQDAIASRPGLYQGPMLAGPNAYDQQVAGSYADSAQLAQSLAQQMQGTMQGSTAAPTFEGPAGATPGTFANYDLSALAPVIAAANRPAYEQLTEQILPSMRSDLAASGAYTNSRAMTTLPEQAIRDWERQSQDTAAKIGYQDFSDYQNRLLTAFGLNTDRGLGVANVGTQRLALQPELANSIMKLSTGAGDLLAGAGDYTRKLDQMPIDDAMARWQYETQGPLAGLDVASILANIANPWGTQNSSSKTVDKTSGSMPIAQALMGAAMTAASAFAPGAGSLGSLFGKAAAPAMSNIWSSTPELDKMIGR